VGEFMDPTMKSGIHENRNETLHGSRKIQKSFCAVSELHDSPKEAFGRWRPS
jgi:hypothetical protein